MARFDVYELRSTGGLVVDVQAELLDHLKTRVVIPLLQGEDADWRMPRLAPKIEFRESAWSLGTPFIIGVPVSELRGPVGSVAEQDYTISLAVDFLLSGV